MYPILRRSCTRALLGQCKAALKSQSIRSKDTTADDFVLPPEPTGCCMSGCANCVWIEYAETLSKLLDGNDEKVQDIVLSKIKDPSLKMFLAMELRAIQYRKQMEQQNDKKIK